MVVTRERRGAAWLLTVDRPASRNAIDDAVVQALCDGIDEAARDGGAHAVVLASTGDVFLSGGDLKQLATLPRDAEGAEQVLALGRAMEAIERCPLPVIAAVDGDVFGGGCELTLMCDLIVMARAAGMRFVHAKMGLTPAWGGATRLTERVGFACAADWLLTARRIDAEEAMARGMIARIADADALGVALALADELGQIDRAALSNMKEVLGDLRRAQRTDSIDRERDMFRRAWGSAQHRAAFDALSSKRQR
jgi:enoyl-CoA hydratase